MSNLLAIDPGPVKSGWVLLQDDKPIKWGWDDNTDLWAMFWMTEQYGIPEPDILVIEYPKPRGMPTSKEEMDTLFEAGRIVHAWRRRWAKVYRQDVKLAICGTARAKDTNIRQALIDRFGGESVAIGGVKCRTCHGKGWRGRGRPVCGECGGSGWESPPGVLHGVASHCWSALAVALTFRDRNGK